MTITIEDFIVAFGSDDIPLAPDGQPDQAKVDWSINAALGTANAYLHAVGLSAYDQNVQSSVKLRILDLARYELNPDHVTDLIKERKADAIKFFGDVGTGRAKLFAETGEGSKNGGFRNVKIERC
ncbi:phage protein Gp36 family protein [Pseudomonas sp. URMO17WK12:I11]|uniref:phage protein Gp36 family protein n=1 Tax=Pseudomonas sp. URMO17WK12:I11 TaxID=1283291 RepID=UPI0011A6AAC7|nr:phage protein Gp36 family protein [Pseudomonas sp. URMO17WK12:I11]